MSQNLTFYIKYAENNAVGIETHYTPARSIRDAPLETVGHLIAAFQGLPHFPLASDFAGNITLHTTAEDGSVVEEDLDGDLTLATLSAGTTVKTALVIKSRSPASQCKSGMDNSTSSTSACS